VETQTVQRHLATPANVEAEPSRMAKVSPPLPGRIVKLFIHFGDSVKQGDPLFTLDSPDLVAAQSDYLKAKSAAAQSERNFSRQKDLVDHGIGAQRELEQAQTDRDTAKSELERTETRLRLLGIGPGAVGGPLTVKSPIAGRVIDLSAAPGQYQNDPSTPIMIVADLSTVWVTASVQEKDLRRVHQGDDTTVSFAAYPGEPWGGKVLFVGDLLDPDTRTTKVRVALENVDAKLKPGMYATVTFKGKASPEIVVPTAAVVIRGEKSSAFVETAPWVFERRDVEVGEQIESGIVVTKGLAAGERVVVQNAVLLP
jgi:cobalt-zinc-cadmium efflux system membrane fusion protein